MIKNRILLLGILLAQTAHAADPRFINISTARGDGVLEISWQERGLNEHETVHIELSAEGTATFVCIDPTKSRPADFRTVRATIRKDFEATATRRGNLKGLVRIDAPAPDFSCSEGQTIRRACVSFSNIDIRDDYNSVFSRVGGTYVTTESSLGSVCRGE